jgi:signal transduction histidine kinase
MMSVKDPPSLGSVTGKWVLIAGLAGLGIQLAWCLHENLSDETYYMRHYINVEAARLTDGARFRDGHFEIAPAQQTGWPYQGEHAAAYGFRILDPAARVLAQSNGPMVAAASPLGETLSGWPDFWQDKIGPRWFEIAGGVKRQVDGQDVWVEVLTLGDPEFLRLNALKAELLMDVWTPLAPTVFLTTLLAIVSVRRALEPLRKAAARARTLDPRQDSFQLDTTGLPREAADFAAAIHRLIGRLDALMEGQEEFVARVAHELRSRLAIELLELNRIPDPRVRAIETDIVEMSGMLHRLITIARLEALRDAGRDGEDLRLDQIASAVIARLLPLANEHACKLSLVTDQPAPFLGNHAAVMEAIRNVVENAIKHGPAGNRVLIVCGPACAITVDDDGPGLPPGDAQHLFEPFERGDTKADGSGLGLAIVKVAVDLHNGSIEVGRSPSGGARFVLRFAPSKAFDRCAPHEQNVETLSTVGETV